MPYRKRLWLDQPIISRVKICQPIISRISDSECIELKVGFFFVSELVNLKIVFILMKLPSFTKVVQ